MTRRELVIEALEHRETPVIPHHLDFTQRALEQLIAYSGDPDIEGKLGACMNCMQYWGWPTEMPERPGFFRDDFGVIWNRSGPDKDIGVVDNPQIGDLESADYQFPVCDKGRLRREIEELIRIRGDRFTIAGFGFSMFERSWTIMGMENVLISMISCPEALEAFYDRICDYHLDLIDIALEYDIDGVYFGDDWGKQQGLIMGPAHWRRFIKPRIARFYERVKKAGKYVIQHSCGDIHEIFPDLIEIGLDCYQTFQPEIYDIDMTKKLYGDRLSFWGGVSTQQCLPRTDAEGVRKETIRIMKALRKGGGLIIAPTHALPYDIPPENILAMADVFLNQKKYL